LQDFEEDGQWCDEKQAVCSATITAKDLRALTSLQQKHKALEDEMVRRHNRFLSGPLVTGQDMIQSGHPLADQLIDRVKGVQGKWAMLKEEASKRRVTLESATDAYLYFSDCNETDSVIVESITLAKSKVKNRKEALYQSMKFHEFTFEVAEVESWIDDKNQFMKGAEYGQDGDSSIKLLTKHKAMELEIDTYSGIVQEISAAATKLINNNHPKAKLITTRDDVLNRDLKNLKNTAKVRRDRLVAAIQLHEYNRESGQFLAWIREMMAGARSEDTGQDYEHLEILLARFQEFKLRVQAGEDKFSTCENLAKRLESVDKDKSNVDMKEVQAMLTEEWRSLIEAIEERDKKLKSAGEMHRKKKLINLERMNVHLSQRASSLLLGRELKLKYWPWFQESLINIYTSKYRVAINVIKSEGDIQDVSIVRKGNIGDVYNCVKQMCSDLKTLTGQNPTGFCHVRHFYGKL
jgi:spectrin beta